MVFWDSRMKIKTDEGIAEPMPLSDIQTYNKWLKHLVNHRIFYTCFGCLVDRLYNTQ